MAKSDMNSQGISTQFSMNIGRAEKTGSGEVIILISLLKLILIITSQGLRVKEGKRILQS